MNNYIKMQSTIVFLILLSSLVTATEFSRYYVIQLEFSNGELSLRNLNTELIEEPSKLIGRYNAKLISSDETVLFNRYFGVPNEIIFDNVDESGRIVGGGTVVSNQTNFTLYLPYYSNAKEIILYDQNNIEKLRINVGMFAQEILYDTTSEENEEAIDGEQTGETVDNDNVLQDNQEKLGPINAKWIVWILAAVLVILLIVFWVGWNSGK